MQTEIKIVDTESKLVNWKRADYLMVRALRSVLIMASVVIACGLLLKAGLWLAGL